MPEQDYGDKRPAGVSPEPPAAVEGNVDLATAPGGDTFVIHQHHARRLHWDLRLEMMNGATPVLVSFAVPKNLPRKTGKPHLAVHVEDHPYEYGTFSGTIPAGSYGAGEVRIFDSGGYELLEQAQDKLTVRLAGRRVMGVYHLAHTARAEGKNDWLVFLKADERPERDILPPLKPMLATSASKAFDDEEWFFEPKWDGVRALAACTDETLLLSRTQRDITATYPELAPMNTRLVALEAVLDGEIVATVDGRPSFELLQSRINLSDERQIDRARATAPVAYIAFDLLYLDGRDLTGMPLLERKALLSDLIVPDATLQCSAHVEGAGLALAEAARARRLEGIVAKRSASPYRPGLRSRDWLKIKEVLETDVVIGGWSRGEGSRGGTFGALLVGAYGDDGLHFLGAVGTGFDERLLADLTARLAARATTRCPFVGGRDALRTGRSGKSLRDPHWVTPQIVARVEYRELTASHRLRAPAFKGIREDKEPQECRLDHLAG